MMKKMLFLIAVLFCTAAQSQTVITGPGDTLQINLSGTIEMYWNNVKVN